MIKTLLFAVNMVHNLSLWPEKKVGLMLNCTFVCESGSFREYLALFGRILLQIWQKREKKLLFHLIFVYSSVNFCIWLKFIIIHHQAQLCRGPSGEISRVRSLHLSRVTCQAMTTDNIFHPAEWCNACLGVQRGQGELVLDQDKLIEEDKLQQIKNYRWKSKNSEAFTNVCWMSE